MILNSSKFRHIQTPMVSGFVYVCVISVYIYKYVYTCMYMYTYRRHSCILSYHSVAHTYIHTYIHAYMHAYIITNIHIRTHSGGAIHAPRRAQHHSCMYAIHHYIHTHTHTSMHAYTQWRRHPCILAESNIIRACVHYNITYIHTHTCTRAYTQWRRLSCISLKHLVAHTKSGYYSLKAYKHWASAYRLQASGFRDGLILHACERECPRYEERVLQLKGI
jgi:hypothetical protein